MYAGFDIGGTNARVHLFDETWTTTASARARLRDDTSPSGVAALMRALLDEAIASAGIAHHDLTAIGVGLAAQLSADGQTVLNAPNLGWFDLPILPIFRDALAFDGPLRVVNDLNALVWGEHVRGAVTDASDVLAIYVGTGIGGGIIANGILVEGGGGKAGEVGHVKVDLSDDARQCGCGQRGCVEAYAGGVHLERQVAALIDAHPELADLASDGRVDLGAADARAADHPALDALWTRATTALATTMANACTLLNPSVLLLGGGVLEHCAEFQTRTLASATPLVLASARDDLDIRFATLGDTAGMLGAAQLAAQAR